MIPVHKLIALFQRMYREHWAYKWGSASQGCVDCAGAFVWAYRPDAGRSHARELYCKRARMK